MKEIYMDMVGGPDFGNKGSSPEEWEWFNKRVAEELGERAAKQREVVKEKKAGKL